MKLKPGSYRREGPHGNSEGHKANEIREEEQSIGASSFFFSADPVRPLTKESAALIKGPSSECHFVNHLRFKCLVLGEFVS